MANEILSSTTASDQEKFLASRLIQRSMLQLVASTICDYVEQPDGTGLTAFFVRYNRMNVPLTPISEGVDPPNNNFNLSVVTVTLDQWGDLITITDVAQATTKHPLTQQAIELISDNAMRVIDREVQLVWLTGTNVQYGDGSVLSRSTITAGMTVSDTIIHQAIVTLTNQGAPPRNGPAGGIILGQAAGAGFGKGSGTTSIGSSKNVSIAQGQNYVGVTDPNVIHNIQTANTTIGNWASTQSYANAQALYNSEVGIWLRVRWVETNFIPIYRLLGNQTAVVTSGNAFGTNTPVVTASASGGALATGTFAFKVTRKSLIDGFEDDVSMVHTIAVTGATGSVAFNFASLATGFVYNLYFDSAAGGTGASAADSVLFLVAQNITVGQTITVTAAQTTGANPPANVSATAPIAVHIVYIHGNESCNWVQLQNLKVMISPDVVTTANPLLLRKTISYKFLGKTMIRDQLRMLRLELASTYT